MDAAPIGIIDLGPDCAAVGLATPFGRIDAATLRALAVLCRDAGFRELRLSPWRALYAAGARDRVRELAERAASLGLVTDPADPILAIDACPGRGACPSARTDTRTDAARLAALMRNRSVSASLHVSGCAKGCARSTPASLVLIGAPGDAYGLVRDGTTRDTPTTVIPAAALSIDLLLPRGRIT